MTTGERPKRVPKPKDKKELSPRSSVHDVIAHYNLKDYILQGACGDNPSSIIIYDKFGERKKRQIAGWFFIANGSMNVEWKVD